MVRDEERQTGRQGGRRAGRRERGKIGREGESLTGHIQSLLSLLHPLRKKGF